MFHLSWALQSKESKPYPHIAGIPRGTVSRKIFPVWLISPLCYSLSHLSSLCSFCSFHFATQLVQVPLSFSPYRNPYTTQKTRLSHRNLLFRTELICIMVPESRSVVRLSSDWRNIPRLSPSTPNSRHPSPIGSCLWTPPELSTIGRVYVMYGVTLDNR